MLPSEPIFRVSLDDLQSGQPVHFSFVRRGESLDGFALLHESKVYAYVNRCPHVSVSLDFGDGVLMDPSRKFIQCQVHGAQFLPESGECFWGPPLGDRLERLSVTVEGTHAHISLDTQAAD